MIRVLITILLGAGAGSSAAMGAQPYSSPPPKGPGGQPSMKSDAELRDVCFVSDQLGWCVGDRGVIWHTNDGGESWSLQDSGTASHLNSIMFLNEDVGWAAGGRTLPHTHSTEGVVLSTRDGGVHWTSAGKLLIPTLFSIEFFDAQRGVAFGSSSDLFPTGVFTTEDGGRHWRPTPGRFVGSWRTGDFIDPLTGAVGGHSGALAVVRRRSLAAARTGRGTLRSFRQIVLSPPTDGWMVGDGGLVQLTRDLGQTWQSPAGLLPGEAGELFNLRTVSSGPEICCLAGAPGTRVFRTVDHGETWTAQATGCHVPLNRLTLRPSGRGWAVGALGTILVTQDGGRTWQRQRAGGSRTAVLGIFSDPRHIPLELFAKLCAEEGYLGFVDVITRPALNTDPDSEPLGSTDDWKFRVHEALVDAGSCGAQSAWRFPMPSDETLLSEDQLLRELDRANDGRGHAHLAAHLVKQIRMWRPSVVVTHGADATNASPLSNLIRETVTQAIASAADPTQFVELATDAGLEPWRVERLFGHLPEGEVASVRVNPTDVSPRLGRSLTDFVARPRGLITDQYEPPPRVIGFQRLVEHVAEPSKESHFFGGIPLAPGGDARRKLNNLTETNLNELRRAAQMRRNLQKLVESTESNPAWLGQMGNLTLDMGQENAGDVLYQLGHRYFHRGNGTMAASTFRLLCERYPNHPLTPSALTWLLQYYASGETALRRAAHEAHPVRTAGTPDRKSSSPLADSRAGPTRRLDPTSRSNPNDRVKPTTASEPVAPTVPLSSTPPTTVDDRLKIATQLGRRLERTEPRLFADPRVRFPLAVAHRRLGYPRQAEQYFFSVRRARPDDAWLANALGEKWLDEPNSPPPKPVWICRRASEKPYLDGVLDDPLWTASKPKPLLNSRPDDQLQGEVWLAFDQEFLYLAIRCLKAEGAEYPTSEEPRPRDPDLSLRDRIELMIDIDRDFATYYRLTIDSRGWAGDSCWNDPTWNPSWYLAAHDADGRWTAEAAIRLADLSDRDRTTNEVWAMGIRRVVPGVGLQSWTRPAESPVRPERFGYLHFQ